MILFTFYHTFFSKHKEHSNKSISQNLTKIDTEAYPCQFKSFYVSTTGTHDTCDTKERKSYVVCAFIEQTNCNKKNVI